MKGYPYGIDKSLREQAQRGTPDFPLAMYRTEFSRAAGGSIPWHWHGELEFGIVTSGVMRLLLPDRTVALSPGEGYFLNANALHSMRQASLEPCIMLAAVFETSLIGGPGSVSERKYVLPLIASGPAALVLEPDLWWQADILTFLREAWQVYDRPRYGYELKLKEVFSHIWRRLAVNLQDSPGTNAPAADLRIKVMMSYVAQHYMEKVTLSDIASAASVSPRECSRCFGAALGMSPVEYLNHYRVRAAADLLVQTQLSITDVCFACGFSSPSYFTKVFRQETNQTPREFKKSNSGLDAYL